MAEVSAADVPFLDFRTTRFAVNVNQLDSISNEFLNIPPDLCNNFWSTNTENQKMITPSDTIINPCCPLLVGPCCSPIRRNDFKKMFLSFVIWQIIAQVVMFFLTKTKDITPLQDYIIDEKH